MDTNQKPLFELRFAPTRSLMEEAYRASLPLWLYLFTIVLMLLCLGVGGLSLYGAIAWQADALLYDGILLFSLGALWLLYLLLGRPKWMAARYGKVTRELRPEENNAAAVFLFSQDAIHATDSTGAALEIPYGRILRVQETRRLILLRRKQNLMHMLDKSGLAPGELAAFRAFLREKAPAAKFSWKKGEAA